MSEVERGERPNGRTICVSRPSLVQYLVPVLALVPVLVLAFLQPFHPQHLASLVLG